MIRLACIAAALLIATPAFAQRQEPVGCDKFKWPLEQERALLTAPGIQTVTNGASIEAPIGKAVTLTLGPLADAKLPMAPERAPRNADSKAGFVRLAAPPQPGRYHITLSAGEWVDVIQDKHFIKAGPFSGATGCDGVRKSVTFDLAAAPLVVQFSGVPANAVGFVMTPMKP